MNYNLKYDNTIFIICFRIFIYLVNKDDIYKELANRAFEVKENEIIILADAIIPALLERLEKEEVSKIYPFRGILVYTMNNKDVHTQ